MDITIGLVENPREVTISSAQGGEELKAKIADALNAGSGVLEFVDGAQKTYYIAVEKIAYVQVGASAARQVGFIA